jgi:hypothetical protein
MKKDIFIPKELKNKKSLYSFGTMSATYWNFAIEMETKALYQINSQFTSFYSFPTIIFYCSTFEAILNEGLNKILLYEKSDQDEINKIKNGEDVYRNLAKKIKACAKYLDRENQGNIKENIIQEYIALSELRNAIIHFNPEFGSIFHYPPRLKAALGRSKISPVEGADWVVTFETEGALDWAKETIKNIIDCFLDFQSMNKKEFYK